MKKRKIRNFSILTISLTTLVAFCIIVADVFFVGVLQVHPRSGIDLAPYVENVNTNKEVDQALRGNIFDRNGNLIATDNRTYDIQCILDSSRTIGDEPAYVVDKEDTAQKLSEILKIDSQTILSFLNQEGVYQTELGKGGRNLSKTVKDEIDALELPGIEFTQSVQRSYPNGSFASNLIGYAQPNDDGTLVGKMGLELYLDSYLSGTDGYRIYQTSENGYTLPGMYEESVSAVNGNNVYLTIDSSIQSTLEESFKESAELFDLKRAWGAVMEINTGKVVAWGQTPSFDPNTLENIQDYNNIGATVPYEPGSTLKTFTWAAAVNEGVYNGEALADGNEYCYGSDENNNPVRTSENNAIGCIYNAGEIKYGNVTLDTGLAFSLNTVAGTIQNEYITPDIHMEYLKKFGFFEEVNTDGLPEETGYVNFTWPADKLALSYGQGSTVTMLQLMQAYSAVFGNGNMIKPYFVESIRDPYDNSNVIYQAQTEITGTPITEESAKTMQTMLRKVIDEGGATLYQIDECDLMGKTGTTQVAGSGEGENAYDSGETITSVMIALPADNPQVLVYYAFDAALDNQSHVKTSPVTSLLRKVAQTYGFTKSNNANISEATSTVISSATTTVMPNVVNHTLSYANSKLDGSGTSVITLGTGNTVINQFPDAGDHVYSGEKVFLLTDTESFTMPDMTEWTRKDVAALWATTGFAFELEGNGIVVNQSIPAGTVVTKSNTIHVVFE